MPNLFAHLAAGTLLFAALAYGLHFIDPAPATLAIMLLACAFPDIDHHKTRIFRTTLAAAFILASALAFTILQNGNNPVPQAALAAIAAGVLAVIAIRVLKPPHRGITHSLSAALLFALLAFAATASAQASAATFAAYLSHLALDGELKLL